MQVLLSVQLEIRSSPYTVATGKVKKHIKRTRPSQKILWITNPILLVLNAVRIFLSLHKGTVLLERVTDFIPNFVVILHKYISFCRLGITFRQIVLKQIKSINKL